MATVVFRPFVAALLASWAVLHILRKKSRMRDPPAPSFVIRMPNYYEQKETIARFPPDLDAHEIDKIKLYYRNHAISALHCCNNEFMWSGKFQDLGWGLLTTFVPLGSVNDSSSLHCCSTDEWISVYVYLSHRGKGHFSRFVKEHSQCKFVTAPSCELEEYFAKKRVNYRVLKSEVCIEYEMIRQYYGEKVATRTGAHMINHIDEGVCILRARKASELAVRAFMLHPLVQADEDLLSFYNSDALTLVDARVLALAIEYRNIANAHLSYHPPGLDSFVLSPLAEVNEMLVADKVQNRKDFELFHETSHPRSARLAMYFKEWLDKLGITEQEYQHLRGLVLMRTGGVELAHLSFSVTQEELRLRGTKEVSLESQPGYKQVSKELQAGVARERISAS